MSEFNQSSPFVRGSEETHSHFSTPYEAYYVLPNGSVTPNLMSHVRFDKYLLSRLELILKRLEIDLTDIFFLN